MIGLNSVFRAGSLFLYLIRTAIVVYCVLSWFRPKFKLFFWLRTFVQPFISPFQQLALKAMRYFNRPIDLTMVFSLIGISVIDHVWWMVYNLLMRMM